MFTLFAIGILSATTLLVLGNLRGVLQDTAATLTEAAKRVRDTGDYVPKLALALLWLLIFGLSFA